MAQHTPIDKRYVLFSGDFQRYGAHIHYDTKNTSAIRLHIVLKRMGIRNNAFHLTLLQPELSHVDPHDPNLDDVTKAKILVECKLNPWYFFREVIRAPSVGGQVVFFEFHRANLAMIWSFLNEIDQFDTIPRQCGKSFCATAISVYLMYIVADWLTMGHFDKDFSNSQQIVRLLKELRDNLPKWMWEKSVADTDRKESISYSKKKNTYLTYAAPTDERSAYRLGRGATLGFLQIDEIAYIPFVDKLVPTVMNSMLNAQAQARKAGIPSSVIFSTTAGNPDTKSGSYALSIVQSSLPFSEEFYDLPNKEKLIEVMDNSGTNHMLYIEMSYRQLGKTEAWFKEAVAKAHASPDDIARDLLNIWQSATDNAIIPQSLLVKMRASKRDPAFVDLQDGFVVRWYLDRAIVDSEDFKSRPLVMGMDTSENVGRDFTVFVIVDPTDLRVLATCKTNDSNTMQIARHVFTIMNRYKGIMWIPERNNTGIAIIDFVIEQFQNSNVNPYLRIYNEVIQQMGEPKYKNVDVHDYKEIHGTVRSAFGYRTSGAGSSTARNNLYKVTMLKALELCHDRLYDGTLISEFCNLTERNGRVDHPDGCHDDHCFIGAELIWTIKGQVPISELKLGDLVLTRKGYRPVVRLFKRKANVITKFGITGTPDHPFITPKGIVRFADLTEDTEVYVCPDGKQSSITVRAITDILTHQEHNSDTIITGIARTMSHLWRYIDRFGKTIKDLFLPECVFTILTGTTTTTTYPIWNVSVQKNTDDVILRQKNFDLYEQKTLGKEILLDNGDTLIRKKHTNLLSEMVKMARCKLGVKAILKKLMLLLSDAGMHLLKQIDPPVDWKNLVNNWFNGAKITRKNQKRQLDEVSKRNVETVYNVTVADCHEYFVNGILVHNCISFLLSVWVIFYGKNLKVYGIPEHMVLQSVSPTGKIISEEDRTEQLNIRRRIAQLEDALASNPGTVLRESYLRELNNLRPLVNEELTSVAPMAITQVRHEEEQISQFTSGSAEAKLRGFLGRWKRA